MNFVDKLIENIGDINSYKAIQRAELEALGYEFSKTFINVRTAKGKGKKVPDFIVYEVLDIDTKKPVSFTYLYYTEKKSGLILKKPFDQYLRMCKDTEKAK